VRQRWLTCATDHGAQDGSPQISIGEEAQWRNISLISSSERWLKGSDQLDTSSDDSALLSLGLFVWFAKVPSISWPLAVRLGVSSVAGLRSNDELNPCSFLLVRLEESAGRRKFY
jgi:hypothetical protein